jgi:hypothetical protein
MHELMGWGAAAWRVLEGMRVSVRILYLGSAGYLVSAGRLWIYLRRRDGRAAGAGRITGPAWRGR